MAMPPLKNLRPDPDRFFRRLGRAVTRRPRLWAALIVALNLGLAAGLANLSVDVSARGLLRPKDPILERYYAFWELFGRDDLILVALEPEEVFEPGFLAELAALHRRIQDELPHLARVASLINARVVLSQEGRIEVKRFLESLPRTPGEADRLRREALSNPLWRNLLVSADGRATLILIELDPYSSQGQGGEVLSGFGARPAGGNPPGPRAGFITRQESREIVPALKKILASQPMRARVFAAGEQVLSHELTGTTLQDTRRFLGLAFLTNFLCLYLMFRDRMGVLLPLAVVLLSLMAALGLMGYLGTPLKLPSMIMPTFLLVVGLADSVHLLSGFKEAYARSGERRGAIIEALAHNGTALTATSVTTALGLSSFAAAEIAPLAELGLYASAGVMIALINSVCLLPALVAACPAGFIRADRSWGGGEGFRRLAGVLARLSTGRPRLILALTGVVMAVSLAGALRLSFSHDLLSWLPADHRARRSTQWIDQRFGGTVALEMIVRTEAKNGLHDPELLRNLDLLARDLESGAGLQQPAGKVSSVVDLLKEVNQALHGNSPDHRRLPDRPGLVAQEFLLLEGLNPGDLEKVVDQLHSQARLTIRVPWQDAFDYLAYLKEVREAAGRRLGRGAEVTLTGAMSLLSRVLGAAIISMTRSYLTAIITISLAMIVTLGSLRLGLASLIPNLAPILVVLGLMGWLGWPLDLSTLLIGSIALGLVVDDTIHFMIHFKRFYRWSGDGPEAIRRTLLTAGRAITVTSLVLVLGFLVFGLASMRNIVHFGLLTSLVIVLAWAADFLVSPAVVAVLGRFDRRKAGDG